MSVSAGTMTVMPASTPPPGERAVADQLIDRVLLRVKADLAEAMVLARLLSGYDSPVSPRLFASLLALRLADLMSAAIKGGWTPADLAQLVRRRADDRYLPALAGLVRTELERHPADRVHPAWFDELELLGASRALDLQHVFELESGLALGAMLTMLPPIAEVLPTPGRVLPAATRPVDTADAQRLAKVRALLAKAESTEFPDEAEALSGKAQELISRYALDRLVAASSGGTTARDIRVRRLWLDPPYVFAKATLVDAVGRANRCRSAVSESLGYVTVVGRSRRPRGGRAAGHLAAGASQCRDARPWSRSPQSVGSHRVIPAGVPARIRVPDRGTTRGGDRRGGIELVPPGRAGPGPATANRAAGCRVRRRRSLRSAADGRPTPTSTGGRPAGPPRIEPASTSDDVSRAGEGTGSSSRTLPVRRAGVGDSVRTSPRCRSAVEHGP